MGNPLTRNYIATLTSDQIENVYYARLSALATKHGFESKQEFLESDDHAAMTFEQFLMGLEIGAIMIWDHELDLMEMAA